MARSFGTLAPASSTIVVKMSMVFVGSSTTIPCGMWPFHIAIVGTRMPPSQLWPLPKMVALKYCQMLRHNSICHSYTSGNFTKETENHVNNLYLLGDTVCISYMFHVVQLYIMRLVVYVYITIYSTYIITCALSYMRTMVNTWNLRDVLNKPVLNCMK